MIQLRGIGLRASACLKVLFWCAGWLGVGFATNAMAGTNTLTSMGLNGGDVREVAFHPTNIRDPSRGGGGGGSNSLLLLAALTLLGRLRAASRTGRP